MESQKIDVARTIGELAGLPTGTRIATNHNKILELDEGWGRQYWIEPLTLSPFYEPLVEWLPAYILPPVVDHKTDVEEV